MRGIPVASPNRCFQSYSGCVTESGSLQPPSQPDEALTRWRRFWHWVHELIEAFFTWY